MSMPVYLVAPMSSPAKGVALYFTLAVVACCVSNLLNRLSDTGQAVVFTLVDTASAELQARAEALPAHVTHHVEPANPIEHSDPSNASDPGLNYTPTVLVDAAATVVSEDDTNNATEAEASSSATSQSDSYIVRAEPKVITQEKEEPTISSPSNASNQSHTKTDSPAVAQDVPDQQTSTPEPKDQEKEIPEDIPSFSEWTQKQLQEAEKKKEKVNTSTQNNQSNKNTSNLKLRSKNYASPDCGAKIIAANPEAISAGSVLSPSRDEYKLNTCTSRIWFIVELCEAIQAKKIDLANFELFSSSPKDFTVSVSDRYPSRDWSSVGQFQAKDERDIQSFNLHPHLFGKFIKVEMLSHWGSEHFCPISLFRVYGTSEFEVLETEDSQESISEDDDEDETLDSYKGEPANNLFGSARDAVMSIVKKAAEVLVKSNDNSNQTVRSQSIKFSPLINTCSTPSHIVVCDNCSDILFGNVYELLSCKSDYLHKLVKNVPIVNKSLYNTDICVEYGLNFFSKTTDRHTDSTCSYISNFFAPKYIAALCNVLAVLENKVVLNVSSQYTNASAVDNDTLSTDSFELNSQIIDSVEVSACVNNEISEVKTCASVNTDSTIETKSTVIIEKSFVEETSDLQIKPTKTLTGKDRKLDSSYLQLPEETPIVSTGQNLNLDPSETAQVLETNINKNTTEEELTSTGHDQATTTLPETDTSSESYEESHDQLDKLLSELNLDTDEGKGNPATTVAPPSSVPQQQQKESVFLRLSNRIKALERNMSLSGQYLEELSRRYKKQVEEMQRAFEKKLSVLTDENKRRDEDMQLLQHQIERLTSSIESLLTERDSLWRTASLLGQFLLIEIIITCILLYFCWRSPDNNTGQPKNKGKKLVNGQVKRRKSIDTIGHESPVVKRKRRPSEEALKISGTYKDLLITDEIDSNNTALTKAEKRRRRKKNALLRSQSVVACQHKLQISQEEPTRRASSSEMNRALLAPEFINGDLTPPAKIQEIPFVLEESEHSSVEPIDYFTETKPETKTTNLASKVSKNGSLKATILKSHSPLFMKTALSTRTKRNSTTKRLNLFKTDKSTRSSPDSSVKSVENNSLSVSDSQDDQTSLNSDSSKKDKKLGGLKRMFKKVF